MCDKTVGQDDIPALARVISTPFSLLRALAALDGWEKV